MLCYVHVHSEDAVDVSDPSEPFEVSTTVNLHVTKFELDLSEPFEVSTTVNLHVTKFELDLLYMRIHTQMFISCVSML